MNHIKKDFDGNDKSCNPDAITGAPGSHPVGTGIGALAGGVAAGAAIGTVAGPAGTIAGAAVGAIVGGLAGKGVAEGVNPTVEDAYWRRNHFSQPYAKGRSYDDFGVAYRTGYEGYGLYGTKGCTFEDSEVDMRRNYEATRPSMTWDEARPASRAAWHRFYDEQPPKGSKAA